MFGRLKPATAALAIALLAACGSPTPHTPKDTAAADARAAADPNSNEKTVFDDLIQTEDKARSVEGTVFESKARTDAAIDAAESNGEQDPDSQ